MEPNGSPSMHDGLFPGFGVFVPGADVQVFQAKVLSQTQPAGVSGVDGQYYWTKPQGCRFVTVYCLSAGSGGGSGAKQASGTLAYGGGGGSSGGLAMGFYSADDLPNECVVYVPCGGAGGAAVTANSTNGNAGTVPTQYCQFGQAPYGGNSLYNFVFIMAQSSGGGGGGGTTTSGTAGSFAGAGLFSGVSGAAATSSNGTFPGTGGICGGGGSGGTVTATPAASTGGSGGKSVLLSYISGNSTPVATNGQSGFVGGSVTGSPPNPSFNFFKSIGGGWGGAGGGSSITSTAAGNGGNGSVGCGGGGGGGALNTTTPNSGAGGNGGDGLCIIIAW